MPTRRMLDGTAPPRKRMRALGEGRRFCGVEDDIIRAARTLFEEKGVRAVTVLDVTRKAGTTRSLFYYHFSGKDQLIRAVLDDYTEDIIESVIVWYESRPKMDVEGTLRACVQAFRRTLYDSEGARPMIAVIEEIGVRDAFDVRVVTEIADYLCDHVTAVYDQYHGLQIDHVREMICLVLFGVVGLMKLDPPVSDDTLMSVIQQALKLNLAGCPEG